MYGLCGQKFVSVLYVRCEIESSSFLIETRWSHPACRTIGTSITLIVSGTTTHYTCGGWQAGRRCAVLCCVVPAFLPCTTFNKVHTIHTSIVICCPDTQSCP